LAEIAEKSTDDNKNAWIEMMNGLLLRHLLIHSQDVRFCPKSGCGYAGTITLDPKSGRIECNQPICCDKCDGTWRDPLQRQTSSFILNYAVSLAQEVLLVL